MKILLVRLRLVGDVVFTTPLIRALRRAYPASTLTYVVEPAAAPVVRGNPHLTNVLVAPKPAGTLDRVAADIGLVRQLRRERYDLAIDLHGGPRSAWLTFASGARQRVGYAIGGRSWMYTTVVERAPDLRPRHSVANQWDLLTPLGIGPCAPETDPVEMPEEAPARAAIDARLLDAGVRPEHSLVVIHVSAGNAFRRWPPASFEALVVGLARGDSARRIVLTSGPSEQAAAADIAARARTTLGAAAVAVPDIGDVDLAELRALIGRAAVYIGGDSGPLHVAATTRTPIVALLGPTLGARSRPWRDPGVFAEVVEVDGLPCRPCHQRHCEPGDFRCLTRIEPARVLDAAERALASRRVR